MGKTDLSAIENLDDFDEPQKPKPREKKKQDMQDKVVSSQIVLALVMLAAILVAKFIMPGLYETFHTQYLDFVSKPPVWDLDGAYSFASIQSALQWLL